MGVVLAFFALALALAAWRAEDVAVRWWLVAGAALNAAALLSMMASGDPHLARLLPADDGPPEPAWRR